jgi:feruloyl esterase
MGQNSADSFARLYMLPGVQHCGGGPGPDNFGQSATWPLEDPLHNVRVTLENWVEKGTTPTNFIVTKNAESDPQSPATMTRPLCPYPHSAKYKGSGDPNSADNFTCSAPKR